MFTHRLTHYHIFVAIEKAILGYGSGDRFRCADRYCITMSYSNPARRVEKCIVLVKTRPEPSPPLLMVKIGYTQALIFSLMNFIPWSCARRRNRPNFGRIKSIKKSTDIDFQNLQMIFVEQRIYFLKYKNISIWRYFMDDFSLFIHLLLKLIVEYQLRT